MKTQYEWEKPKLIILGRGRPEEQVLLNCKRMEAAGSGGSVCKPPRGGACAGIGQS